MLWARDPAERERRDLVFAGGAFLVGAVACFLLTGPRVLAGINWDNGSWLAECASGKTTWWTETPWNAHFALHQAYWLGVWVARRFGGTYADGFRVTTALAFGGGAAVIFDGARRLAGSRLLGALVAAAWATSWVTAFLVLTLEDNILYFAPAAGVLWLCALRADTWRLRDSLAAGACAGAAALFSWQAVLYLLPAFYCAVFAGERTRRPATRARDAAALLGAFFAVLLAYVLFLAATTERTTGELLRAMFGRPTGNFAIRSLGDVRGELHALGVAAAYLALHTAYELPRLPTVALGAVTLATLIALYAAATLWSWRRRSWPAHVLAATLLLFAVVSPLYQDVDYRYMIRYDFVPIAGAFLLAVVLGDVERPRIRAGCALLLGLLTAVQLGLASRWDLARLSSYPTLPSWLGPHPSAGFYGREGRSWYAYFRGLRAAHPRACRYVLAYDEIADGKWNLDVVGSLWSELPAHEVVGDPAMMARFRFPPRAVTPAEGARYLADGCSFVSPDAARLLTSRSVPK